jgi:hypothetical protein
MNPLKDFFSFTWGILAVTSLLKDFLDPSTKDFGRDKPSQGFFLP